MRAARVKRCWIWRLKSPEPAWNFGRVVSMPETGIVTLTWLVHTKGSAGHRAAFYVAAWTHVSCWHRQVDRRLRPARWADGINATIALAYVAKLAGSSHLPKMQR
jgi:hypothetical protein